MRRETDLSGSAEQPNGALLSSLTWQTECLSGARRVVQVAAGLGDDLLTAAAGRPKRKLAEVALDRIAPA